MRDRRARTGVTAGPAIAVLFLGLAATVTVPALAGWSPVAAEGEVAIEVMANGQPADSAPGPTVDSGAAVTIRYVITIGSSEPLFDFVVTNETGDVKPDCDIDGDGTPDGTNVHPGGPALESGDSFVCVASVVAGDAGTTYASIGRVRAYNGDITETFVHDDAAHFTTVQPTTTQAPTTAAPTTAAPATTPSTASPATSAPTTAAPATDSTGSSTTSLESVTTSTSTSSTTRPVSASSTTPSSEDSAPPPTEGTDPDAAPPAELAADDESGGIAFGWLVLASALIGAGAAGIGTHIADRGKNAAVPDP